MRNDTRPGFKSSCFLSPIFMANGKWEWYRNARRNIQRARTGLRRWIIVTQMRDGRRSVQKIDSWVVKVSVSPHLTTSSSRRY